ncbi:hypothetical protein EDC01DRAFT_758109 [Geopyxis carbonaria]|nr:hypothetical protein EDC01DRAFT_758109 [Geopyxis carbonaria]
MVGDTKALAMEDLQLMLEYQAPPVKNSSGNIRAFGSATLIIAGFGAQLTFAVDPASQNLETFLSDKEPTTVAAQQEVIINVDFGDTAPSLKDILQKLAGDNEIVSQITGALPKPLVDALNGLLDFLEYREIEVTVSRPASSQKWQVSNIHVSVNMGMDVVSKLNDVFDGTMVLENPVLAVTIMDPGKKDQMEWHIYLSSDVIIRGVMCEVRASFFDPPPGIATLSSEFGLEIECGVLGGSRGLKLGDLVLQFAGSTVEATGLNIGLEVPQVFRDAISSVDVRAIRVIFSEDPVTKRNKVKWLEAIIEVAREPLKIIDNFELSDILLHFTHNTGLPKSAIGVMPNVKSIAIALDGNLKLGSHKLSAAVSHNTTTGSWTISITDLSAEGIDIIALIEDCVPDMKNMDITGDFTSALSSVLKLNISTFFIAYTPAKKATNQLESISFAQKGQVSFLRIGSDSLEVICEKSGVSPQWNSTVAVAIASPCYPFKFLLGGLTNIFDGIKIENGYLAVASGAPASKISKVQPGQGTKRGSVLFTGTLVLGGDDLLRFMSKLLVVEKVDLLIAVPSPRIEIGIEKTLKILDGFSLTGFMFRLEVPAVIALGARFEINAPWFCQQPVGGAFSLILGADSSLGAEISVGDVPKPFGLAFLELKSTFFSIVFLAAAVSPKSIGFAAGVTLNVVTLVDIVLALTTAAGTEPKSLPDVLKSKDINIGFKNLAIDTQPSGPKFDIRAEFYLFFIHGRVEATANLMGLRFAANMDKIDVLGLVKVTAANNDSQGPFVYLDTTATSLTSGTGTPPKWLNASTEDDANFAGALFATTGKLKFLGSTLSVYGYISAKGLHLVVASTTGLSAPGVSLKRETTLEISINSKQFSGSCEFLFEFTIDFSAIDFLNVGLGKLGNVGVSFHSKLTLQVNYGTSAFAEQGLVFTATIDINVLGIGINTSLELDVSIKELEDTVPDAVKGFIEDEVVDGLENVVGIIGKAFEDLGEDVAEGAQDAYKEVEKNFNIGAHEMAHALMEAGQEIDVVANMLKDGFDMTMSEVAGELLNLGEDINSVANAVGNTFEAFPNEVASGLVSAGVSIEHALDSAFSDAISEMSGAFNLVGNSIVGFGEDAIGAIGDFVTDDMKDFLEDLGGAILDGLDSVIDEVGGWFDDHCVIM